MYIYKLYILTLYFYICRYEMTELKKRQDNNVGFVDPNVVFKHPDPRLDGKLTREKSHEPTKQGHTLPLQLQVSVK